MKRRFISFVSLVLVLATVFSVAVSAASAGLPSLSTSKYIQTYTLSASGKIYAYTDSSLKTRKGNGWYIDCPTDECRIVKITSTAVQVSYPIGNGKWVSQPQWFRRSDFTQTDISRAQTVKVTTARITTYRKSDGKTTYGSTGSGDQIYVLGSSGNYTQVIYELTNGNWKMGWIKKTDAGKYLKDPANVSSKINAFLKDNRWKEGTSWKGNQTTKYNSAMSNKSWGCCAYAADYIKYVYGVNYFQSGTSYSTASAIRAGDVIQDSGKSKNGTSQHWMVVLSRSGNTIRVAEGNYGLSAPKVHIGTYTISGNNIMNGGKLYKTFTNGWHY